MSTTTAMDLLSQVRSCTRCTDLPLGPRPVLQWHPDARILIAGQAPGRKVHQSGVPFDDASGKRLREWLGVTEAEFYDARRVAILPMAFCYPGTGASGDLPPPAACARHWRKSLMDGLRGVQLTVLLGRYAVDYHLDSVYPLVTDAVRDWSQTWPQRIALPHPSPRNNRWLKQNPWFEREVLPPLRRQVATILHRPETE